MGQFPKLTMYAATYPTLLGWVWSTRVWVGQLLRLFALLLQTI